MLAVPILLAFLLFTLLGLTVTAWLVHRFWKSGKLTSTASKLVAAVVCGSALVGGLGTLAGLVMAFGAVGGESVDPSQKARMLGEGIASAMNCFAFGLLTWLPSTVALLVMTRPRKAKPDRRPS
jgi:hypothetical protein